MKLTKSKLKQIIKEALKEASIRGTGDVGRSVYARRAADPQWQPTGEYETDPDKPGERNRVASSGNLMASSAPVIGVGAAHKH